MRVVRVSSAAMKDGLSKHAKRAKRDVFEVADGRGDDEESAHIRIS